MAVTLTVDQLGAELLRRRTEKKLSLRQVESETGISAATLSRIERGSKPEFGIIQKIADWLDVNIVTAGDDKTEVKTDEDLKRVMAIHLRANRNLPETTAQAILDGFEFIMRMEVEKGRTLDDD
jgi:transcriptional regulator with XRE-family HTH domain